MNEAQLREYFARNWVFRLFKAMPFLVAVVGIPLLIFVAGGVVAAILRVWDEFRCNILAYPVGVGIALAAYGWFALALPKLLARAYPAFETTPDEFGGVIKTWADRLANNHLLIALASLVVGFLNLQNLDELWGSKVWIGDVWARSGQQVTFFKSYFGITDVVLGGFLLGSGTIGVLGSVVLVYYLMKLPLKLSHYRCLRAIGELSIGLTIWTLVGFALIVPAAGISAPNIVCQLNAPISFAPERAFSNLVISILSIIVVISGLGLPLFFAHQAIVRAKAKRIAALSDTQHEIDRFSDELDKNLKATHITPSELGKLDDLNKTFGHRTAVDNTIKEIESIPEWPITWQGVVQIGGAAIWAIVTNLWTAIVPILARLLGIRT